MKPREHIITILDGDGPENAGKNEWPPFEEWDRFAQEAFIELIVSIIKNKHSQE